MQAQILWAVRIALHGGSEEINATFKKEVTKIEVNYLRLMNLVGSVSLNEYSKLALEDFIRSGKWKKDSDRTVAVILTDKFDYKWFVECLRTAFEKIEVVSVN